MFLSYPFLHIDIDQVIDIMQLLNSKNTEANFQNCCCVYSSLTFSMPCTNCIIAHYCIAKLTSCNLDNFVLIFMYSKYF